MGAEDEVLVLSGCPEWDKHGVAVVGLKDQFTPKNVCATGAI